MRRFILAMILLLPTFNLQAYNENNALYLDGISFFGGFWDDDTFRRGYRVAGRWNWDVVWLKDWYVSITGYWEAGLGRWYARTTGPHQSSKIWVTSASPMFQFWLGPADLKRNALFFEFGVGPAYLSEDDLGKRDFGSQWHFEDKFGVGINLGTPRPVQFVYRYVHYSNASLVQPNEGLDLHTFGFTWFFT